MTLTRSPCCFEVRQSDAMTDSHSAMDPSIYADAVVVGYDGSPDAARAVRWAYRDAGRRSGRLVVLRAWSLKTAPRPAGADLNYVPSEDEFAAAVRDALAKALTAVLGPEPTTEVVPLAVHRPADVALIEASSHAAVVVVGARGSGLARLVGSVSVSLVRGAHGPVVVIPPDGERRTRSRP